jgi:hypothetical protein
MMQMMQTFLQEGGEVMFREQVTSDFVTGTVLEWMRPYLITIERKAHEDKQNSLICRLTDSAARVLQRKGKLGWIKPDAPVDPEFSTWRGSQNLPTVGTDRHHAMG